MPVAELLPPGIDPKTPKIGIRKVTSSNDASCRSVMNVRSHPLYFIAVFHALIFHG